MPEEVKPNVFTDMIVSQAVLLDVKEGEGEDGVLRARWQATTTNVLNDNLRVYPDPVMDTALTDSQAEVEQSRMVGESPHPKHYMGVNGQVVFDTKIENSVIKVYNQFKEDGKVYIDAEVLDTAKGRDLKALINAKIPVGISMRALGDSVKKKVNGVMADVATRLKIVSWDVVMNPATAGSEVVAVLTDSQVAELMQDDVQITIPNCPKCSNPLTPQDPDNDNDLDFYSCEPCKEVYIPDESKTIVHRAEQVLRTLPNDPDYDGYGLAREYKRKMGGAGFTDAVTQKEGEDMTIEEILAAMQDNPQFNAMVDAAAEAKAKAIAQPALDAIEADRTAKEALATLEASKAEAKAFVDGKVAELKGKVHDKALELIADKLKDAPNKDVAGVMIDSLVGIYSTESSKAILDGMGFDANNAGGNGGQVRVEVTHEEKPWAKHMKPMADAMDREAIARGETIDPSIRKANQAIVDKLIEHAEKTAILYDSNGQAVKYGYEAMKDSAAFMDAVMNDSVSVTTQQVLNQPVVSALLLTQTYQDTESTQFLGYEVFDGDEVRFMSETYNSIATINPASGVLDILSPEGAGIQESSVSTNWLTYNPAWRKNAISMTTEVQRNLITGPAKYDVMSRGIFHISAEKRRIIDNLAYLEMVMASDEYKPTAVASETASAVGASAGQVTSVSNDTNVVYSYKLTVGGAANTTAGTNPVVRPRSKTQALPSGQKQTVITNAFTVTVPSTTQVMGYLDANGNIAGTNATYAVDFENGIVYFKSTAGVDGTHLPTFAYSAMTNYDRWSLTKGSGYTKDEEWYNTLLQKITTMAAYMGAAPRYKRPNVGIMSTTTAAMIQNASLWYALNNPPIGKLIGLAENTHFGDRSNVALAQINAPWVGGDSRILFTQKGSTKYAIQTPYQIEGPFPKYDTTTGNIVDAKIFYGRENSVMATPLVQDATGTALNPVSRTLKITP